MSEYNLVITAICEGKPGRCMNEDEQETITVAVITALEAIGMTWEAGAVMWKEEVDE